LPVLVFPNARVGGYVFPGAFPSFCVFVTQPFLLPLCFGIRYQFVRLITCYNYRSFFLPHESSSLAFLFYLSVQHFGQRVLPFSYKAGLHFSFFSVVPSIHSNETFAPWYTPSSIFPAGSSIFFFWFFPPCALKAIGPTGFPLPFSDVSLSHPSSSPAFVNKVTTCSTHIALAVPFSAWYTIPFFSPVYHSFCPVAENRTFLLYRSTNFRSAFFFHAMAIPHFFFRIGARLFIAPSPSPIPLFFCRRQ